MIPRDAPMRATEGAPGAADADYEPPLVAMGTLACIPPSELAALRAVAQAARMHWPICSHEGASLLAIGAALDALSEATPPAATPTPPGAAPRDEAV